MKYFIRRSLFIYLLLCLQSAFADVSVIDAKKGIGHFETLIADMERAASTLRDASYIFHKQEYADGQQQPAERIAVKYRAPNDIYMKWLGPVHQGRELLFRPGWNGDRLRVSPGRWLPTVNLAPNGYLAMRGNRHDIFDLPFPAIVQNFVDSLALVRINPALLTRLDDLGEKQRFGETGHCYHLKLAKDREPRLYAAETELCVSLRTGLPLIIKNWDREGGQMRLVENYAYENVQPNVGLGDSDFDPENPSYGF